MNVISTEALWVIIPFFNEETNLALAVTEWLSELRAYSSSLNILLVNDGSTDGSLAVAKELKKNHAEISILTTENRGHGMACVGGYSFALKNGAEWIFQVDSDGQCDPHSFSEFWRARENFDVILGHRSERADGLLRKWISRALSCTLFFLSGNYIPDINVPYRLIKRNVLLKVLPTLPTCHLSNALITYRMNRVTKIHWVKIYFRKRFSGKSTYNFCKIFKYGLNFFYVAKVDSKNWQQPTSNPHES